jgi:hypothetical protein
VIVVKVDVLHTAVYRVTIMKKFPTWLACFLLLCGISSATKTLTTSVAFTDPQGNVLNAGTINFRLCCAAKLISNGQVVQGLTVSFTLTSGGLMPGGSVIIANDELTPSSTYYIVNIFSSAGEQVRGPENWVLAGSSPIDLSTIVATGPSTPSFPDPVLKNPSGNQVMTGGFSITNSGGFIGPLTGTASGDVALIPSARQTITGQVLAVGSATPTNSPLNACIEGGIAYVGSDAIYATCWGSSELGAQLNAAMTYIAGLTEKIGVVKIQPDKYTVTTPILKPYWVRIDFQYATIVSNIANCTIVDGSPIPVSPDFGWTYASGGLDHMALFSGGSGGYGVCSGGDPSGILMPANNWATLETHHASHVHGFSQANWLIGDNTAQSSWFGGVISDGLHDGIKVISSATENLSFFGTQILGNGISGTGVGLNSLNGGSLDIYLYGVSMDYNPQGAISFGNGSLSIHGGHYEQLGGYIINGQASALQTRISIEGAQIAMTRGSGVDTAFIFVGGTNSRVSLGNGNVFYMGPGQTVNEVVNWQSAGIGNTIDSNYYTSLQGTNGIQLPLTQAGPNIQFTRMPEFTAGQMVDQYADAFRAQRFQASRDVLFGESGSCALFGAGGDILCGDPTTHGLLASYNGDSLKVVPRTLNASGAHSDSGLTATGSAAGCTTAASIGGACASGTVVTLSGSFSDTNYKVSCSPSGTVTNLPGTPNITSRTVNSVTVNYFAITAAAASWGTIECTATHN